MLRDQFQEREVLEHAEICLRLILMQSKEQMNGLRPFEEINQLVSEACTIKQLNPKDFYTIKDRVGKGGYADIFRC